MKARRITEITTQTDEAFVIRRRAGTVQAVCPQCGPDVPMITPEEAALLFRVSVRVIYRAVDAGQVHFQETPAGSVEVCLGSLQQIVPLLSKGSSSQIKNTKDNKEIQS